MKPRQEMMMTRPHALKMPVNLQETAISSSHGKTTTKISSERAPAFFQHPLIPRSTRFFGTHDFLFTSPFHCKLSLLCQEKMPRPLAPLLLLMTSFLLPPSMKPSFLSSPDWESYAMDASNSSSSSRRNDTLDSFSLSRPLQDPHRENTS